MSKDETVRRVFGEVLGDLRRRRRLSQEQLSFELEMDRSFMSLLERGQNNPTLRTMLRFCGVFNIKLSTLAREIDRKLDALGMPANEWRPNGKRPNGKRP
jgi:transcriptional regulator with XRE-family HTH domain